MGMDKYSGFKTLAANETLNRDYKILVRDMGSDISIVAPHGGLIEPKTSLITKLIAGDTFNYYCFEGIKDKNNQDLHITSHRFDEPKALDLISLSDIIITIHACKDIEDAIYVGGCFKELVSNIQNTLGKFKIKISKQKNKFPGTHPDNICNKGRRKRGVQLEISRGLRDDFQKIFSISTSIRKILQTFKF